MKTLIMIAGINGAGKTTLRQKYSQLFSKMVVIDSDDFLKTFNGNWRKTNDRIKAILQANKALQMAFEKGQSIVWEVEMAIKNIKIDEKLITKAHDLGYQTKLIYVTVKDAALSLERVLHRFKKGGYGGSQLQVKERYQRVSQNIIRLLSLFDEVVIFDNTHDLKCVYDQNKKEVKVNLLTTTPWIKIK